MSKTYELDLSFLRNRRVQKRVGLLTAAFATGAVLYAVLTPNWYRTVLTVVPGKGQRGGGLSSMLAGELGGLATGLADSGAIGGDVHRIAAVMQSIDVSDAVIARFDLKARYGAKHQESAREALWKHCEVHSLPKPTLVKVSCEDTDPLFAKAMLEYFAEYGNRVFRRVGAGSASEQVRFLEKRTIELRAQADAAAARMREFQEKHQIVDLETQTKAVVGAIAALNSQRISKQLELDYARTFSSGDEASTRQLESQIAVVDQELRALAAESAQPPRSGSAGRSGSGMFPAALSVPKLRAEFEGIYRDRKVAEATLIFALERLESAKADEARDTSTFFVLDPPAVPTRKDRPRRLSIILVVTVLGLGASVALELALSVVAARSARRRPRAVA